MTPVEIDAGKAGTVHALVPGRGPSRYRGSNLLVLQALLPLVQLQAMR